MELFKTLLGTSKKQLMEKEIASNIKELERQLDERIATQNEVLRSLGLRVPLQKGSVSYKIVGWYEDGDSRGQPRDVEFKMPTYEVPPYTAFCIQKNYWMVFPKNDDDEEFTPTPIWTRGLADLTIHKHACLTAHPYEFYEAVSGANGKVKEVWFKNDIKRFLCAGRMIVETTSPGFSMPCYDDRQIPKPLSELTYRKALDIHFRASLLNNLTDYRFYKEATEKMYADNGFASRIRQDILLDLPLEAPALEPSRFPDEAHTNLRVLPAGEIKPALMSEFWESLRPLNCAIAFELLAAQGSVFFRLGVPTRHVEVVQRSLERFFPKFAVIEDDDLIFDEGAKIRECHAITHYSYQYSIKKLKQFSVDPYSIIAHILERRVN